MHNSNNITKGTRGIATILLLSQLLTSCNGFKETIVPSNPSLEPIPTYDTPLKKDQRSQPHSSTTNTAPFSFRTETIEGTAITFTGSGSYGSDSSIIEDDKPIDYLLVPPPNFRKGKCFSNYTSHTLS